MSLKDLAKSLQREFFPKYNPSDEQNLQAISFRKTTENEIHRCCAETNYDSQSGPIYCGDIADYISNSPLIPSDKLFAFCEKHKIC